MKPRLLSAVLVGWSALTAPTHAAAVTLASPVGSIVVTLSDNDELHYRIAFDGAPALADSRLGLDFEGGFSFGRRANFEDTRRTDQDGLWENAFGQRRVVPDHNREMRLALREDADAPSRFSLIVRAYDHGVAFRYELPEQPGLESYVITEERTAFMFPADFPCWAGDYSDCAENQYPEKPLRQLIVPRLSTASSVFTT